MVQTEMADDERPSNTLELFSELSEVLEMIENLRNIHTTHFEKNYEIFSERLGRYQEQPHLLDPHLERLITNLLAIIRDENSEDSLAHSAFKYLYQLSKVRTFKALVKFLPHEISDLDFVLTYVERQQLDDSQNWETRYVLLLWLSILVLNPFQMSRLDAFQSAGDGGGNDDDVTLNHVGAITKAERIYKVCTTNVNNNDTCALVAAFLASKYLIRIDIKDKYLPVFFGWIVEMNAIDTANVKFGQLAAVSAILKHGKREDLLVHAQLLLKWILGSNHKELGDFLKSKFFIKIIQRLGLVFLKPRLANWRYQRGSRSLTANLTGTTGIIELQNDTCLDVDEEDADIVVPDEIEDVVEELLQALRSPSSDIRWSAAKGIGRVTNRLPKALGDEVVGSVIEILNPLEPHEAWHGGCLAIAELSKRGLLLPYRLEAMVPILLQALIYDEMKGYMSVGQHIRDAACYMSWAFARAYEPAVLQPFIQKIAAGLIVTTVFDREINCRRAASAAFQESVGRLGNFPHGIDILTEADFYTVGVRSNSYLQISDYVAQFDEYTRPLIDHLIERKINHWDTAIREITAKSLFRLTKRDPAYLAEQVLPTLFDKTNSIDVNLRHGSVLAIGEVVRSLKELEQDGGGEQIFLSTALYESINALLLKFLMRDQFRGLSGDIMNHCCCDFIRNCSFARIPATAACIDSWQSILDACMIKKSTPLREIAVSALAEMCEAYYSHGDAASVNANTQLVERYLSECSNDVEENVRMGYVSALGILPRFMLAPRQSLVVEMLMRQSLKPEKIALVLGDISGEISRDCANQTFTWAEARRDSVKALTNVAQTLGFSDDDPVSIVPHLDRVFTCLLTALQEYTVDDRGDIGAWVREASMNALYSMVTTCPEHLIKPATVHAIMAGLAQQSVEIIDRTRGLAGSLFCKLVNHDPVIPHIPRHGFLKTIVPEDTTNVLWIYADHTFPMFCAMLALPEYSERLIIGLSASIGKLSESLVKYSSAAVFQFLRANANEVPRICQEILNVFESNLMNDRITHPLLNFLDSLMASGTINAVLFDDKSNFAEEVYRLVKTEIKGQKKLYKLVSSINVFCQLIQVPKMCTKVLTTLSVFLGLTHVHVRKSTASKLYEAIVIHGDSCGIPEENVDEILEILSETDWGQPLTEIRPIRNSLCILLGIKPPISLSDAKK